MLGERTLTLRPVATDVTEILNKWSLLVSTNMMIDDLTYFIYIISLL
jgi:hypothetical protein